MEKASNLVEIDLPTIAKEIDHKTDNINKFIQTLETAENSLVALRKKHNLSFDKIDTDIFKDYSLFQGDNSLGNMFVFYRVYKEISGRSNQLNFASLEHVLPQKISNDWPNFVDLSDEEKNESIFSLGNFVVTHKDDNSLFSNKSFKEKKSEYINNIHDPLNNYSDLKCVKIDDDKWTKELIEKRRDKLIKLFEDD